MILWQCNCCGEHFSDTCLSVDDRGWPTCRECAEGLKDYAERAARGDCHCCITTPDTRPGPNGGHWHPPFPDGAADREVPWEEFSPEAQEQFTRMNRAIFQDPNWTPPPGYTILSLSIPEETWQELFND